MMSLTNISTQSTRLIDRFIIHPLYLLFIPSQRPPHFHKSIQNQSIIKLFFLHFLHSLFNRTIFTVFLFSSEYYLKCKRKIYFISLNHQVSGKGKKKVFRREKGRILFMFGRNNEKSEDKHLRSWGRKEEGFWWTRETRVERILRVWLLTYIEWKP